MTGCRLVVVEKGRLAAAVAAGCAAHAGKAPMHSARGHSSWSVKYGIGLRVQVGFEMGTGEKVKEESECLLPVLDSWNSESVLN